MTTMRNIKRAILCLCLILLPATAAAETKKSPLEGQPAVRHRLEYRKARFELGPSFAFTLNRMVRHGVTIGLKASYHINDWLEVGADVGYGIGFNTALANEIGGQYQQSDADKTTWQKLQNRWADIKLAGDIRAALTPMSGKIAIFSRLVVTYDFYGFAGFGFALTKNSGQNPEDYGTVAPDDIKAANDGFRPGFAWGFGFHLYFNRFFGMGFEFKDLLFSDNETGGDLTRGLSAEEKARLADPATATHAVVINGEDKHFSNHFFAGISFVFFLPPTPDISW
jgi:outer membrane beta-barrel protein